jgi:hypothetical protein
VILFGGVKIGDPDFSAYYSQNFGIYMKVVIPFHKNVLAEDYTRPDPSFFHFAHAMLELYRNNPAVMHISGNNYQDQRIWGSGSYSQWAHSWGWATWRRAWKHYCVDISRSKQDWDNLTADLAFRRDRKCLWFQLLKGCANGTIST